MITPRKLLLAVFFSFIAAGLASASDIYFAQNAAGSNNGSSCANAYAYNDGTNGINNSANWVAGNTLHLCGTISVGAGQNIITAQSSGSSGNPITVKFEPGAILQSPVFGSGNSAGINLTGHNYITIDGGNTGNATAGTTWTGGVIQNTRNGSGTCPAGTCTTQSTSTTLIQASSANNITIENLNCSNSFVITSATGTNPAPGAACVYFQGSNMTITNNQMHWNGISIDNTAYGNASNTVISNNDFQDNGWGLGCAGANVVNTNYAVFNNHFHNFDGYANGNSSTHINGIHCYDLSAITGTYGIQSFFLYNNLFDGPHGNSGWTAWAYFETDGTTESWAGNNGTLYAFNNVFVAATGVNGNGLLNFGGGSGHQVFNNFFYGQLGQGTCANPDGPSLNYINNVFENCGQVFAAVFLPTTLGTMDYNLWANASSGNPLWALNSSTANTLSDWQSVCNCDAHSQKQLSSLLSNITSEGVPSAGYIGVQAGTNLDSLCSSISAINSAAGAACRNDTGAGNSRTPLARPSSGAWDIGAYQFASGGAPPQPPSGLAAIVQ